MNNNNTNVYNYNIDVNFSHNNKSMSHCENLSGSSSSVYDNDISPLQFNENYSQISSKKSDKSIICTEDSKEFTVDSLERTLTEQGVSKINDILIMVERLSDTEKLLLQLRFPLVESERNETDNNNDIIGGLSDFGINQTEHSDALAWVSTHLEEDTATCLKKQEVYDDYKSYCVSHNVKYLSTADFGKVMKRAYPNIKARRLGARGQSKYCYSGLKNRNRIKSPVIADVGINCKKVDDKNSDIDSVSSNCQQPDLSNIPEYDLNHNILIDSALVIIDFIKRVGLMNDVTSLKQAVERLLLNNQVDMRTPHALRLLPHFQNINNQRSKKKYLVEQVFKTIKKEETLSGTDTSPQLAKRSKISSSSPMTDITKVACYYDHNKVLPQTPPLLDSHGNYCAPHNFNYGSNHNQRYYNNNLLNIQQNNIVRSIQQAKSDMSPLNNQKQFIPNTFSTPIKNSPSKISADIPSLDSPLLDRNPTTKKKLELSKTSNHNNSVNFTNIINRTNERSSKAMMYNYPLDYDYEPTTLSNEDSISNQVRQPNNCSQSSNSYPDQDPRSPMPMTSRNYDCTNYDDEYACDIENFDVTQPLKRHIGSDFQIDFNPNNHFSIDNDYRNLSLISSGYRQQSCEEKEYLDTPSNSPTNRSTEPDPSEGSSRTHTPQTYSSLLSSKDAALSESDKANHIKSTPSYHNMIDFVQKDIFHMHPANTIHNPANEPPYSGHHTLESVVLPVVGGANDEFSVSSTTNTYAIDSDVQPSTTIIYK